MSNPEVLQGLQRKSSPALTWLVREYRASSIAFVASKILDQTIPNKEEVASELFNEALIALVDNVRSGRLTDIKVQINTYLIAIMKYRHYADRKRSKRPPLTFSLQDEGIAEEMASRTAALRRHLREIGGQCRELITLFYFDKLPYEEIVRMANFDYPSIAAARMKKSRCLNNIRQRMAAAEQIGRHA